MKSRAHADSASAHRTLVKRMSLSGLPNAILVTVIGAIQLRIQRLALSIPLLLMSASVSGLVNASSNRLPVCCRSLRVMIPAENKNPSSEFPRKRTDNLDAWDGHKFLNLVQSDLGVAGRYERSGHLFFSVRMTRQYRPGPQFFRDAKAREYLGNVYSARAAACGIGPSDGSGGQQCSRERFRR